MQKVKFEILEQQHAKKDYSDKFKISSINYKKKSDQHGKVEPGGKISFSSGDKLSLQELEFNSEIESNNGAWAEAYLYSLRVSFSCNACEYRHPLIVCL